MTASSTTTKTTTGNGTGRLFGSLIPDTRGFPIANSIPFHISTESAKGEPAERGREREMLLRWLLKFECCYRRRNNTAGFLPAFFKTSLFILFHCALMNCYLFKSYKPKGNFTIIRFFLLILIGLLFFVDIYFQFSHLDLFF